MYRTEKTISIDSMVNMSGINRFYLSDVFRERGGQQSIMPKTSLSDHSPIILNIREAIRPIEKQRRIPESIFSDLKLARDVDEIWRLHMQSSSNILKKVSKALENTSLIFKKQVELCYVASLKRRTRVMLWQLSNDCWKNTLAIVGR